MKKKGEVSGFKKFYHNTTAYYNAYFNANELMEASMLNMQASNVDNYSQILDVYDYTNLQNPKSEAANLDKAIEKVSRSASLHRQSQWVDDCYVVIGKAQFYKQDYESAKETFQFMEEEFDPKNPYGSNYDFGENKTAAQKRKAKKRLDKQRDKEKAEERKEKDKAKKEERKERDDAKKIKEKERKEKEKARAAEKKARDKAKKQAMKDRKKGKRSTPTTNTTAPKTENPQTNQETTKTDTKKDDKLSEEEQKKADEEKKKEEEENAKKYRHEPAYYSGLYWLARTNIQRENYSSAEYNLNRIMGSEASEDVRRGVPAARAQMYLKKKEYDSALTALEEAISVSKSGKDKARYAFIKAQIFERMGNSTSAFKEFARCKSFKPLFEMEFYAILNEIKLSKEVGKYTTKKAINKMEKMLVDEKYKEYAGPIHHAIGDLLLKDGDIEGALAAFKLAASNGSGSNEVDSYYQLATLYYNNEEYADAKEYYDKTLEKMTKTDERYAEVKKLSGSLSQIATAINNIALQDSLLRLAELSDEELIVIAEAQLQNENNTQEVVIDAPTQRGFNRGFGSGGSNFFAYNPLAINQGKVEFNRTWGERVLEDNWRRSNRPEASSNFDEEEFDITEAEDVSISKEDFAKFKQKLPLTKTDKDFANIKIQEAMYELGILYRDKIQNYEKSASVLEDLLVKFPTMKDKDKAYFYLYLDYADMNQLSESNRYKKLLLEQFPDSEYTKIANDPDYTRAVLAEENKLENFYDQTYRLFKNDNHDQVLANVAEAESTYGEDNEFQPKFTLLKAMSIGSKEGKENYINALNVVTKKYPKTDEAKRAKEILRFLKGDKEAFDAVLYEEASEAFTLDAEALHYVAIIVYKLGGDEVDKAKIDISKFNREFFKSSKLQMVNIFLNKDNESQIILVRKFSNQAKAMDYYNTIELNKDKYIQGIDYDIFPVSQKNYREIVKQRSVTNYRPFFEKEYQGN